MRASIRGFLTRLSSAHLMRVLILYGGASWAIIQVLDVLDHFGLPDWFFFSGIILVLLGVPVVVGTALLQAQPESKEGDAGPVSPASAPEDALSSWRRQLTWSRAIGGGFVAFVALGMVALAVAWWRDPGKELDRNRVAVMPFNAVGSEVQVWREGLVDLVSTALDGTGLVVAADPRAVLVRWQKVVGGPEAIGTRAEAGRVARELEAGRMILGSLIATEPGRVRVLGEVYDVRWMSREGTFSLEGPESEMDGLVDRLTVGLLKSALEEEEVPEIRISAITTTSPRALRLYLEGNQAFRRSRFQEARVAFQRAVELDSTFAAAAYGLSRAAGWTDMLELGPEATLLAARHASGLDPRDSLLILGRKMMEIDSDPASIELYEHLTRRYPEDFEAWYGLAEALFHHGHEVGYHLDRVVQALDEAYAIDSTEAPTLFHGIQSAFMLEDSALAREWGDLYLALDSASVFAESLRLATALRFGALEERAQAAEALDTVSGEVLDRLLWFAPPGRKDMAEVELVLRASAHRRFSASARAAALRRLASEYLRRGRIAAWRDAETEARSLDGGSSDLFPHMVAHLAGLLPGSGGSELEARVAAQLRGTPEPPYLLVLRVHQGELEEVARSLRRLERRADSLVAAGDTASARELRGSVLAHRGHMAAAEGDTARAVDLLGRGVAMIKPDWGGPRGLHRFLLAGLLAHGGDEEGALRIYRALRRPSALEAPAYLQAARLCEGREDHPGALRYYTWFVELWEDADPHLQPQVEEARRAIARLSEAGQAT